MSRGAKAGCAWEQKAIKSEQLKAIIKGVITFLLNCRLTSFCKFTKLGVFSEDCDYKVFFMSLNFIVHWQAHHMFLQLLIFYSLLFGGV